MITKLSIRNFKSLKHIALDCKKVNLFIGEPNGGMSNIIEAISLISQGVVGNGISKEVLRYKSIEDLFFNSIINKPIKVISDGMSYTLSNSLSHNETPENQFELEINFPKGSNPSKTSQISKISRDGQLSHSVNFDSPDFKFYRYKRLFKFELGHLSYLVPPFGGNLPGLLLTNDGYRNWANRLFESSGLTLTLKPTENDINVRKKGNKSIYSYPFLSISETLQLIIFYNLAIQSNKVSILLFDGPECNTFPSYTKFLAERIALDESNQFFLAINNPYLLLSLIEKSKMEDINVIVMSMKHHKTNITVLDKNQIEQMLDFNVDVFFNLDRILS
jgi:AAA15 family ATPase/GTPase